MLTLQAAGTDTLWDGLLPEEVRVLPDDLARLDELLGDPGLVAAIASRWEQQAREAGRSSVNHGRPTIAMETYVR